MPIRMVSARRLRIWRGKSADLKKKFELRMREPRTTKLC